MRAGYTEIDFSLLNKILNLDGATVIGGTVISDHILRLYLTIDEKRDPFDHSSKFLGFETIPKKS